MMSRRASHLVPACPRRQSTVPMESNMQNSGKLAQVTASDEIAVTFRRFAAMLAGLLLGTAAVRGSRRAGTL